MAALETANAQHITFLSNSKLRAQAEKSAAGALILSESDHLLVSTAYQGARIITANPYAYFARAAQFFVKLNAPVITPGIHASAIVDSSARIAATAAIAANVTIEAEVEIGENCVIGAGSFVGRGARIGSGTVFHPQVTFLADSHIGERGVIQSGAVIGSDGFGFANDHYSQHGKHISPLLIEDPSLPYTTLQNEEVFTSFTKRFLMPFFVNKKDQYKEEQKKKEFEMNKHLIVK
jgi:UDP-3-O-[3-hydroxymyristoyl] glucosamine N-acyltransferase